VSAKPTSSKSSRGLRSPIQQSGSILIGKDRVARYARAANSAQSFRKIEHLDALRQVAREVGV